jgi:hypothetical protein
VSDLFFQDFYNSVKDPSWPTVENYCDFSRLPNWIQDECKNLHAMDVRLAQMENPSYWQSLSSVDRPGWRYQNIIFVPVPKCGWNYYNDLFGQQLGWEKVQVNDSDFDQSIVVSVLMHPLSRYLKGITEWIWANRLIDQFDNLEQEKKLRGLVLEMVLSDIHTVPYSMLFPNVLSKMKLIPMDLMTDLEVSQSLERLFDQLGHKIPLPTTIVRKHQSPTNKLKLYQAIKQLYLNPREPYLMHQLYRLYTLYSPDLKFYRNLIDNFDPKWSSITHTQATQ